MLQAIRDRVSGIVAIFVLGLLAVPFMFFGIDQYFATVPQDAVATVGDSEITRVEFQGEFQRYRAQLRARQGEAYDELQANSPVARREFLESMIERQLLVEYARKAGIAISPSTIAEVIRQVPAFQVDGQFSPDVYRQRVASGGRSVVTFEQDLARDLLVQQLPSSVSSSVIVTEADVDRWLRVQMEQRDVALLRIDSEPYLDPEAVTDEKVRTYYDANTAQFMRPAEVSVEYVVLDTNEMAESLEIDDQELRERYEATRDRFMTPERRRASHILVTDGEDRSDNEARQLAEDLRQRIEAGEAFAALAGEYSDDPGSAGQGGDLGWIEPDVMMPEFEEALYAIAEPGQVSDPVETEFGWHLIQLDEIDPPRGKSFAEARAEILDEIRAERADDMYVEMTERLIDMIYADPTGLPAIAGDLGLELETAGPYSRGTAEGVLADPAVLDATFSDLVLIDRQASEPVEVDRNRAVVVHVTDHRPEQPRALDDVREEIVSRLARESAIEVARERADALVEQMRSGEAEMQQLADADDALTLELREVTRRSFELGGAVLDELFRLPVPGDDGPVYDVIRDGNGWVVARLDAVTPGDPASADQARRDSARQQILFSRSSREFDGLMQWLRANTEITIAAERLDQ